jgi:VIT1/CCC1 family predicted Fe2+/Mn2+ transporter
MAAGNFLSTRAEHAQLDEARKTEERHIAYYPEGEREEVRQIFARKGFSGDDLERVVDVITSDPEHWVNTMLHEELGLRTSLPSPGRAAAATFVAFAIAGMIPLLPFAFEYFDIDLPAGAYAWSTALTGLTFFVVGAAKARFTEQSRVRCGIETLLIGGTAAAVAYTVGMLLRGFA